MLTNRENTVKTDRKLGKILGINVLVTRLDRVIAGVKNLISHNSKFYIVTPNPELVLMAQHNKELRDALNDSDLPVPDGVGLRIAIPDLPIIKGRDLFMKLIDLANENKWRVFFLGGLANEAGLAAERLRIQDLGFKIGTFRGPILDNNAEPLSEADKKLEKEAIDKINRFAPQLLFVAFGNPKQEIWINKNLSKLKIGGAMAVGGTFRYVAGMSKLPPKWMEKLGLEWLFRLFTEPARIVRIFNAVIIFPLRVLLFRIF